MLVTAIGLGISLVLGLALAVVMDESDLVRKMIYHSVVVSQTIPITAIAPLFVLWFGYGIWSKVLVTVLITFFPITITVYDGLRSAKTEMAELLETYGATKKDIFLKIKVPCALPYFFSAVKMAVPMSIIGAAIGEWLGAKSGLGYFSRRMMTQLDGAGVFAPIVLLSAAAILAVAVVNLLEKRFVRWRGESPETCGAGPAGITWIQFIKKGRLMMKQKLALLLTALLLLTGCSSGGSGDTADGQDDGELETIDVVLDWYPNAVHAFLYEAEEKGYFAEEGLQVNILFPSNASDPLTMTAAGRADIGFYYQEDTIIAKANEDVPVKVLGAVVQQPISIVCALAEKNIKTPEDLIGKTIGYSGTRFGEVAVGQMLETVGATLDDVELIDVGFDLMSAMTTGNVDATFGCFINHEVPALEEEGFAVDYMEVMDYGVPNYYALMLVTGEDQLEANRDKYTRFLRACQKGFADMQADPEEALGLLLANQDEENFPLTESVERRSFDVLLPIMETADAPFLSQDVSVWQENIDWLQKVGMIDAAFDPAEVMVDLLAE